MTKAERHKQWREANKEYLHEYYKRRKENPAWREHLKEYGRKYRAENKERIIAQRKVAKDKIKQEIFAAYGNICTCCGEYRTEFLSIDHIDGSGNKHREELGWEGGRAFYVWLKKRGFPKDNYRLLCMNCNFARGVMGYCPHEKEKVN